MTEEKLTMFGRVRELIVKYKDEREVCSLEGLEGMGEISCKQIAAEAKISVLNEVLKDLGELWKYE